METALLDFLDQVPALGDCLLINGDLFDFWFAWRSVVPRSGVRVAGALASLRRRIPVVLTGGNHDRWGGSFWERDMGIQFHPNLLRFEAAGRHIEARHGDGLAEQHRGARLIHRLTRSRALVSAFGLLHPDVGMALIRTLSPRLADSTRHEAVLDAAMSRQESWAATHLTANPTVDLLVLGHTHRAQCAELHPGRFWLNPGAWMSAGQYAVVTPSRIDLLHFPID